MSNNKQSSLDLLFDHMVGLCEDYDDGKINYTQYCNGVKEMYQKAKAMHNEEIDNAWLNGVDYRDAKGHASTYLEINLGEQPNKFYNETYGGNK